MNDPKEIKVLVKKADGTFVHVPLSQLKKEEKEVVEQKAVTGSGTDQPIAPPPNLPIDDSKDGVVSAPAVLRGGKPSLKPDMSSQQLKSNVKFGHTKLTEPAVKNETSPKVNTEKGDYTSLLEEELPTVNKIVPLSSPGREKQIEAIINGLSFKIPSGNTSRLRTVIQLFLKDVRGESDTVEILRRREIDGGLGLSSEQSAEVVEKCKKTAVPVESVPVPVLKERKISNEQVVRNNIVEQKTTVVGLSEKESGRLEKELPIIAPNKTEQPLPVKSTVKMEDAKTVSVTKPAPVVPTAAVPNMSKKILDDQVTKASLADAPIESFRINPDQIKPTMHDVRPGSVAVGPVDEIRNFNLVDFRRLSTDPVEAASRLKQKFLNLREESIMLYFEGLEAWKESPIFHDYIKAVSESIAKRIPLAKVTAGERTRIQMPEISALVRMEKQLG